MAGCKWFRCILPPEPGREWCERHATRAKREALAAESERRTKRRERNRRREFNHRYGARR